ncbi:coiled-coil domain-containing protein 82 isoform X1 [Channa argus]|uniref:coiled-coil domain-containing protein 82 isoform X1 n=1 Tax=Channa argus TaxID=215402 RepID=UPI00351FF761
MESLYKRKMFASMRKTKVAASKKRQIGLPASILDDSDEGSFSSSSSSGSQSDFQSSPEDQSESGATSSDDSRSVTRRKRSFLGGDDSSSSSSQGDGDEEDEEEDDEETDRNQTKRMVQPRKRSRLQRQEESDSDQAEEKRREEAEKAKRRQRHNKLLALSRRMKARVPSRRRSRLKQVHLDPTTHWPFTSDSNSLVQVTRKSLKKARTGLVVMKLGTEEKTAARRKLQEVKKETERRTKTRTERRTKRRTRNRSAQGEKLRSTLNVKNIKINLTENDTTVHFVLFRSTYSGKQQLALQRASQSSCVPIETDIGGMQGTVVQSFGQPC